MQLIIVCPVFLGEFGDAVGLVLIFRELSCPKVSMEGPVFHNITESFMDYLPLASRAEEWSSVVFGASGLFGALQMVTFVTSVA